MLVRIVRERNGMLSFFVRRMKADEAVNAERRARLRGASEIWRLMMLLDVADWMTYSSNMDSFMCQRGGRAPYRPHLQLKGLCQRHHPISALESA